MEAGGEVQTRKRFVDGACCGLVCGAVRCGRGGWRQKYGCIGEGGPALSPVGAAGEPGLMWALIR